MLTTKVDTLIQLASLTQRLSVYRLNSSDSSQVFQQEFTFTSVLHKEPLVTLVHHFINLHYLYSFCIFCGARLFKEKGEAAWTCAQVSMSMHKGAVHSQHLEHLRIIGIKSYPSYSESHLLLWLKYSASQGKQEPSKQRLERAPAHERKRGDFNARWQFCHFMADFRSTWCHVQSCPCPKDGFFSWPYVLVKGFDDTDTKFLHCPSQPMCCQKIV